MKRAYLVISGTVLVFAAVLVFRYRGAGTVSAPKESPAENRPVTNHGPCPGKTETVEMNDIYMKGIIEKGTKFRLIHNYYACNPVKRGDFVYYRISQTVPPVVKIARGVPGDKFKLLRDKQMKAWNLEVNGDLIQANGKPYFFGGELPPALALYEKSRKGVLGSGELILLSSWAPGDIDSGLFGLRSVDDVIGKVEAIESSGAHL